ncbi:hypothetical protein CC79DRAFT_1334150 [Sarocladium strictum]|jgi:hypothetical protein
MANHARVVSISILIATTDKHPAQSVVKNHEHDMDMLSAIRGSTGLFKISELQARRAVIERIFHPQATWFESNGNISPGCEGILLRTSHLQEHFHNVTYRLTGKASVCQNLVTQSWEADWEGQSQGSNQKPLIVGRDVVLIEGSLVKAWWTLVDEWDTDQLAQLP